MAARSRRLYLVACVAGKQRTRLPARDLYSSDWFRKARAYVENQGAPWFILSAKHHLVKPTQIIGPYQKTLNNMSSNKRKDWAAKVASKLRSYCRKKTEVVMLAGNNYTKNLLPELVRWGCKVEIPLKGKGIGQQLRWLKKRLR